MKQCDCGNMNLVFDSATHFEVCVDCVVVVDLTLNDDDLGHHGYYPGEARTLPGTGTTRFQASLLDRAETRLLDTGKTVRACCSDMFIEGDNPVCRIAVELVDAYRQRGCATRGRKRALALTGLYLACKHRGIPREIRSFAAASGIEPKTLTRALKSLMDFAATSEHFEFLLRPNDDDTTARVALVDQYLNKLDLGQHRKQVWRACVKTLDKARGAFDWGKKPRTIVVCVIFTCCRDLGLPINKKSVSAATDVCVQSIDKTQAFLVPYLNP